MLTLEMMPTIEACEEELLFLKSTLGLNEFIGLELPVVPPRLAKPEGGLERWKDRWSDSLIDLEGVCITKKLSLEMWHLLEEEIGEDSLQG